jgi:hypothetical protein
VDFDSTVSGQSHFLIRSPTFGYQSKVVIRPAADPRLVNHLGLGKLYGGFEEAGAVRNVTLENAAAMIVVNEFRRSVMLPQFLEKGIALSSSDAKLGPIDETIMAILVSQRGVYRG